MLDPAAVRAAGLVVQRALAERVFPAAVAEAGDSSGTLWREAFGTLTFDADAVPVSPATVFDLASLTKPIATTSLIFELIGRGRLSLDDRVSAFFPEWLGDDRQCVTLRDLLEHASGLPARLVDQPPQGRREFEHEICAIRLEYPPRSRSVYSDLDFILLGFVAADAGAATLPDAFDRLMRRIRSAQAAPPGRAHEAGFLGFGSPDGTSIAPTMPLDDDVRRGRVLTGEAHDNYAAALGGAAGHSGLFGTAGAVGAFARVVLRAARGGTAGAPPFTPEMVALATARSSVPGSSRAAGWDTMLPTSSCGSKLSSAAFGHVGFTGTSLWIDPMLDRYFVLLTNRAAGGGTLDQMRTVRRAFHDALA